MQLLRHQFKKQKMKHLTREQMKNLLGGLDDSGSNCGSSEAGGCCNVYCGTGKTLHAQANVVLVNQLVMAADLALEKIRCANSDYLKTSSLFLF